MSDACITKALYLGRFSYKRFLEKIINLRIIKELADLGKIHLCFPKLATCKFSSNLPLFSKIHPLFSQTCHLSPQIRGGATNAAIWAEQQLVAIPGWLREDQNAILHQEGQFASIKEPRSPTTKKNKAKRRTIYCGGGGNKMATQDISPSHRFSAKTLKFSEKSLRI